MCDQVEAIYHSIEYIEAHLEDDVTVAQIAESVGYSLFHFIRTFNRMVHQTPYDYLTRRRLSEAAQALTSSKRRIIDIAQDYCFNNQESFSRAFKRMFDMQPSQWRARKQSFASSLMPSRTKADLQFTNRDDFQYPLIVDLNETSLAGLMTALEGDYQAQERQRNRVIKDLCKMYVPDSPLRLIGITSYTDQNRKCAYYFIGVKGRGRASTSLLLVEYVIPIGRYVSIVTGGNDRQAALNYLYFNWCPKTGLNLAGQTELEIITFNNEQPVCTQICIPIDVT